MSRQTEVQKLIRRLRRQGFNCERNGSGHWQVTSADGRQVAVLGNSPSDVRSVQNALAYLRAGGFNDNQRRRRTT